MLFRMRSNMLFRLFHLLTAQVGSNFVIICTNSWDCYNVTGLKDEDVALLAQLADRLRENS